MNKYLTIKKLTYAIISLTLLVASGTYLFNKSNTKNSTDIKQSEKVLSKNNPSHPSDIADEINSTLSIRYEKAREYIKTPESSNNNSKSNDTSAKASDTSNTSSQDSNNSNTEATPPKEEANKGFKTSSFSNSQQVITVTNSSKGSKYATVNAYEKDSSGNWNIVYSDISAIIGENGMEYDSKRKQNTNTTPAGIYNIVYGFGWGGNPGSKYQFKTPDDNSYWDLNSGSPSYNRWVEGKPNGDDYEQLKTEPLYKYALVLDYNWGQAPDKGGAIFIHMKPRFYTGGCVGISEGNLLNIIRWVNPSKNPKVLICPSGDLSKYYY